MKNYNLIKNYVPKKIGNTPTSIKKRIIPFFANNIAQSECHQTQEKYNTSPIHTLKKKEIKTWKIL